MKVEMTVKLDQQFGHSSTINTSTTPHTSAHIGPVHDVSLADKREQAACNTKPSSTTMSDREGGDDDVGLPKATVFKLIQGEWYSVHSGTSLLLCL